MTLAQGLTPFVREYFREVKHQQFAADLTTLLTGAAGYRVFCAEHVGRDVFLDVEPLDLLTFSHIHRVVRSVADHLGIDAKFKNYSEVIAEDLKQFKDPYTVHELSLERSIKELRPLIGQLILNGMIHVAGEYGAYWRDVFPELHRACAVQDLKYVADEFLSK